MSFASFESKLEDIAHTMLDHAEVTKGLKEKVGEGEAALSSALRSIQTKLAEVKDEILTEARKMVDDLKSELLGDFDQVKTDTVEKAKDAVAALKADAPASDATSTPSAEPAETDPVPSATDTAPEAETPPTISAEPVVATAPSGATTVVVPAAATDIHTDDASGALTMPGTTSHIDASGTVTMLDHATGTITARDAADQPAEVSQAASAEVSNATAAAGVAITPSL